MELVSGGNLFAHICDEEDKGGCGFGEPRTRLYVEPLKQKSEFLVQRLAALVQPRRDRRDRHSISNERPRLDRHGPFVERNRLGRHQPLVEWLC